MNMNNLKQEIRNIIKSNSDGTYSDSPDKWILSSNCAEVLIMEIDNAIDEFLKS